ncbi:MAG: T9SS type A sorting domain-containing protein [Bacteroidales bacterium]|nr:T9SS type A sorting domain-containing protein [Bacteroidales bacterium]
MIEIYNLDGMPVYKYRTDENKTFEIGEIKSKCLPCGIYFVKIKTGKGIVTSKLLVN